MANGFLIIKVCADNKGQPVENATITVVGDGFRKTYKTDISGETEIITVECPCKEYTFDPQSPVRPYGTYDVIVETPGMAPKTVKNASVFDGVTSVLDVILEGDKPGVPDTFIPDSMLWGPHPPKSAAVFITERSPYAAASVNETGAPVIPETITVHDGLPANFDAPDYTVDYVDYIKNIVCSEVYPTWPTEAVKAVVYAVMSLTLSRIHSRRCESKGCRFTITSAPQYDQKYIHGRNIFIEAANIVDEMFTQYIKRKGREFPFFSQVDDGFHVNSNGRLSKWGSLELAEKGYDALSILKYYYGFDVVIGKADIKLDMPTDIAKLQAKLNVIRSSYHAIPIITEFNGVYGPNTEAAVKRFQSLFKMPVNGVLDVPTVYKIEQIHKIILKMISARHNH